MQAVETKRYAPGMERLWNDFVRTSKNGTFLFDRRYMDYHSDRFKDFSLMFFRGGKLYALLPANVSGATLYSHQGLTYGGLVMGGRCTAEGVLSLFQSLNDYLRSEGIRRVVYKAVPWIYHSLPSEEDLFALTDVCQARLSIRDISTAIVPSAGVPFTESRKSGLRKAKACGLTVAESDDIDTFWQILNDNLTARYGLAPVHTAEELRLLSGHFPNEIRLWLVGDGERAVGGTLLYVTPRVVHTQYISATPYGKEHGALDLLFDHIVHRAYSDHPFIDFGKSTSTSDAQLNRQLIFQKEGFGGRAVCYDTYEWTL